MIYLVDASGKVVSSADSNDLDAITSLNGGTYAVHIDDATVSSVTGGQEGTLSITGLTAGQPNKYNIPTATGTLTFTPTPAATLLANAQNAQIETIDEAFSNSIGKFTSSALGSGHTYTYLSDSLSMNFLNGRYTYVRSSDYKGENVLWYTMEAGKVAHTGAQIAQVFLDGQTWMIHQELHKDRIEAQIKAATTVSQAQSYLWTTPPNVPTGLTSTAGTGQASLTWTANTEGDLAGYNVYQDGVKVNPALLTVANDTITGLASGSVHSFTVTAVDVNGNESAHSAAVSVTAN